MYKIITITESRVLVDYSNSKERALALYDHLALKLGVNVVSVVLAYVPKNPRELKIIQYCYR